MQIPSARRPASATLAFALLCAAAPAWAKPRLEIAIAQAKEVIQTEAGAKVVRMVATKEAAPGDLLEYTLTVHNAGDEEARDAVVSDPIPKGTSYVAGSASSEGSTVAFSTDGGKSYASAVTLTYEVRLASGAVEKRVASPSDYTHVRWTLRSLPAGATAKVSFRVRVS